MVWIQVVIAVVMLIVSYLMQPKAKKSQGAAPAALDDFDVPTATEDRVIPQVFGRRLCESPNVVWYGNLRTKPIKK